jgi:hypothetical protein
VGADAGGDIGAHCGRDRLAVDDARAHLGSIATSPC